jgi:hypothetical protein
MCPKVGLCLVGVKTFFVLRWAREPSVFVGPCALCTVCGMVATSLSPRMIRTVGKMTTQLVWSAAT